MWRKLTRIMNTDISAGFISVLSVKLVGKVKDDTALGWRLLPGSPISAALLHETSFGIAFYITLKIFERLDAISQSVWNIIFGVCVKRTV